ncbi:hypothetical protein ABZY58_11960 [Micromonospora tulbaghiae]|uniref:hypothetical protein n=1 Tax=Micromonospora tulbaghiae TaxID=479978 RepID=UPI0033B4D253
MEDLVAVKPISYPPDAEPLIKEAARLAKLHNKNFSQFAIEALEDKVKKVASEPTPAERWAEIGAEPANAA